MLHAIELFAILLLVAVGEGVLQITPKPVRRIAVSVLKWMLVFAAGISLLSVRPLAAAAVQAGLLLLTAYLIRWIIDGIVQFRRGPTLIETPGTEALGELAEQVAKLPAGDCRRIARRILRRHEGSIALLGLLSVRTGEEVARDDFEQTWIKASEDARTQAMRIASERGKKAPQETPKAADVFFAAQALCLYERESVERVLAQSPEWTSKGRAGRAQATSRLRESGRQRREARELGLAAPSTKVEERGAARGLGIQPVDVLWPPMGLIRAGFKKRAAALAVAHAALIGYGVISQLAGRDSGWFFIFPGVYFTAAALIHVEALFAIGDFQWLAAQGKGNSEAEGGTLP